MDRPNSQDYDIYEPDDVLDYFKDAGKYMDHLEQVNDELFDMLAKLQTKLTQQTRTKETI